MPARLEAVIPAASARPSMSKCSPGSPWQTAQGCALAGVRVSLRTQCGVDRMSSYCSSWQVAQTSGRIALSSDAMGCCSAAITQRPAKASNAHNPIAITFTTDRSIFTWRDRFADLRRYPSTNGFTHLEMKSHRYNSQRHPILARPSPKPPTGKPPIGTRKASVHHSGLPHSSKRRKKTGTAEQPLIRRQTDSAQLNLVGFMQNDEDMPVLVQGVRRQFMCIQLIQGGMM